MHGGGRPAWSPAAKGYQDVPNGHPKKKARQPGPQQLKGVKMYLMDTLGRIEKPVVRKTQKKMIFVQRGERAKTRRPSQGPLVRVYGVVAI